MQGVKLSPNAKSFVPEFFRGLIHKSSAAQIGSLDITGVPGYMTASYSLADHDYAHNFQ